MTVCQEKTGKHDPETIKAVGAFAGGIGATGSVCGILLAAITVVSSICSRSNLKEKEDPRIWSMSQLLITQFEELTSHLEGSTCRDITQVDWKNRYQAKMFYLNPNSRRKECIRLVGEMAYILGELLEKEHEAESTGGKGPAKLHGGRGVVR